jgi:phytoene dehydrogenase-like protein
LNTSYDAVIIGSGPNGLSAGIELARNGFEVLILEAASTIGGGLRTSPLTLPGFQHDFCSAVHPTGILSPYWKQLPLEKFGLKWICPPASVAHPLDGEPAVILSKSLEETVDSLGKDGKAWKKLISPFLAKAEALISEGLKPLGIPEHPLLLARFGMKAMLPATLLANLFFKSSRGKALFAGNAGHSILPLSKAFSSAIAMMFSVMAHTENWPVAKGGSQSIANTLMDYFISLGGTIQTNTLITHFDQLPSAKVYLFDTDPYQLASIAEAVLPNGYKRRLRRYNFGPGVFKVDWALNDSIPWKDPNCLKASTVHIGGTMKEIALSEKAAWNGQHVDQPFVMLCQQSEFDPGRAPEGKHTGYAYCHVPNGSDRDMTEIIETQIERFAPGFKDIILARHSTSTKAFQQYNPNYFGGAITGGAADISQLFTRPVARLDPHSTPNPKIFICSASTPPGGGVHGMCGYYAAKSALKRLISA